MSLMVREITDELHNESSLSIGAAFNALRQKFNIKWIQLNPKSKDVGYSSSYSSPPISSEADRTAPTKAELFLLICSLFPTDFKLPIEDLVVYGMALKLFGDVCDISEGTCGVYGFIEIINHQLPPRYLNKLCPWEDKYGSQYVIVFSSAKDLAKLIASKYQLVLGCNENVNGYWPNSNRYEYFYGISPVLERINNHPFSLGCPQLQHRDDSESSLIDVFEGVEELMILSLDIPIMPESFSVLWNLRTLHLNILKLEDIPWSCLINLEFLSISTPTLTDIPKEMGQLVNLRLLDLRKMSIAYIPPSVLSKMLKLKELYFPVGFQRWGCCEKELDDFDEWESWEENDNDKEKIEASNRQNKRINASISDIASLSLHALEISIPDASVFPKISSMFNNIRRFKIFVPKNLRYKPPGKFPSTNVLQLRGDAYDMNASGICKLMSRTEELSLMKVRNAMNVMFQRQVCGFPKLQKMIVSECHDLEYIAKSTLTEDISSFPNLETLHLSMLPNLKEIWHGSLVSLRSFENLSQISIRFCNKLKYAYPLSIVKGSTKLKSIHILDCVEMNGIFYQDEEDGKDLVLYSIEELHLHSLPKLVGFLVHEDDKISGVHDDSDPPRKSNEDSFSMNKDVVSFTEKSVVFISSKLADTWMQDLKRLEITHCDALQIIFSFEENHAISSAFNSLKELKLIGLHNLVHIWFQVPPETTAFQNMQLLVISECHNLYVFSPCVAKFLVQLQKLYINQCERMEEVVMKEKEEESDDKILFPRLRFLECDYMLNLKVFYSGVVELPKLECLKINQCNKMKCISYKSTRAPKLERILINGSSCASMGDLNATTKRNYFGTFGGDDDDPSSIESFDEKYNIRGMLLNVPDKQDESDQQKLLNTTDEEGESDEKNSMLEMLLNATDKEGESDENNSMLEMFLNATNKEGESDEKNSLLEMLLNTLEKQGESDEKNNILGMLPNTPDKQGESIIKDSILDMLLINPDKQGGSDDEFDGFDETDLPDITSTVDIYTCEPNGQLNQSCIKEFAFADLKIATDNFSSDALLGRGVFSKVYKGWLDERTLSPSKPHSGMAVAIKKIFPDVNHSVKNWQSEKYFLERLSHPNLIKLLGYCREDEDFLLVHEFMQRGSLADNFLERNLGIRSLTWELRIKIAIGAARGLTFLHTLENKVIHRDVKPSHIFLDGDYNTRIADFGSALWGPFNGDSLKKGVEGTVGYYDPEYVRTGHATEKSDVYSFGVVLLQLMTGLTAIDWEVPNQRNLVGRLKPILRHERKLRDMMDSTMEGQYSSESMLLMAKIASRCLEADPERRPPMGHVLQKLQQLYSITVTDHR